MGILSWITGGGDLANKTVDAVIRTGDALVFTDEEKSVANQKILDWTLEYAQATNAQNVARRIIAVTVVGLWGILILAACIAGIFDRNDGSYAVWLFDVLKDVIGSPYNIIIGFYFLTGTIRAWQSGGTK